MIGKGDLIHLIETSLDENDESPLNLEGHKVHLTSVGNGKGIATYYNHDTFKERL